jgi:Na+/H+ antiporter NhaD/arsenite permease-like protein
MVEFGVLIALGSLAAVGAGVLWRTRAWPDRWPLALVVVIAVVVAAVVASDPDPEVSGGAVAKGVAIAAVGLAALPLLAYYALGRFTPNRVVVGVVWLVSLVPAGIYVIVVALVVAGYTQCSAGENDCPI